MGRPLYHLDDFLGLLTNFHVKYLKYDIKFKTLQFFCALRVLYGEKMKVTVCKKDHSMIQFAKNNLYEVWL